MIYAIISRIRQHIAIHVQKQPFEVLTTSVYQTVPGISKRSTLIITDTAYLIKQKLKGQSNGDQCQMTLGTFDVLLGSITMDTFVNRAILHA